MRKKKRKEKRGTTKLMKCYVPYKSMRGTYGTLTTWFLAVLEFLCPTLHFQKQKMLTSL